MRDARAEISIHELAGMVGREVTSDWLEVTQDVVSRFAAITRDEQWIHVDADRARRDSPYGTTIAHGFLTLSLISHLMRDALQISGGRMAINYGLNKVRFPAPLPTGSRIRGRFTLDRLDPVADALQATWRGVVEREGSDKPCCAAEWLVRYYP